jgi:hypothetical protein
VAGWVDYYRRFWEESFDRLDDYLQEMKAQDSKNKAKEKKHVRTKRKDKDKD